MFPDRRIANIEIAETMAYAEAPYRVAAIAARRDGFHDLAHDATKAATAVSDAIYEHNLEVVDPDLYLAGKHMVSKYTLINFANNAYGYYTDSISAGVRGGHAWSALVNTESMTMLHGNSVVPPEQRSRTDRYARIPFSDMVRLERHYDSVVAQVPSYEKSPWVIMGMAWKPSSARLFHAFVKHTLSEIREEAGAPSI